MTGWASVQKVGINGLEEAPVDASREARIGVEIRSVNSRFLDLTLRVPDALRAHETALRQLLTEHCKRGKVELRVAVAQEPDSAVVASPTPRQLQRLAAVQSMVRNWLPNAAELSVADALRLCQTGPVEPSEPAIDAPGLLALAEEAIRALLEARASEGARLAQALLAQVAGLRELAHEAEPLLPALVTRARQRFLDRWRDALQSADGSGATLPEAAQDRALAEATAFALRIDVAEELTRLASHLDEIEQLLGRGGEVGKRLEFLIQELQREANTMGSKSAALELSRIAVDMKVLIEQMREQVQNLE